MLKNTLSLVVIHQVMLLVMLQQFSKVNYCLITGLFKCTIQNKLHTPVSLHVSGTYKGTCFSCAHFISQQCVLRKRNPNHNNVRANSQTMNVIWISSISLLEILLVGVLIGSALNDCHIVKFEVKDASETNIGVAVGCNVKCSTVQQLNPCCVYEYTGVWIYILVLYIYIYTLLSVDRLCKPQASDIILDPMCGTGAIPLEVRHSFCT